MLLEMARLPALSAGARQRQQIAAAGANKFMALASISDIQRAIHGWRERHETVAVEFSERVNPEIKCPDDYLVTYEASFKSLDLEKLQLFLYATKDSFVGIGVETRERVATRAGARSRRPGYAAGHEPGPMSIEQLIALLDAASDGRISLLPRIGIFGLKDVAAILTADEHNVLPAFDTSLHWRWLRVETEKNLDVAVLRFKRW
ncbi:hypothetical protein [Solimonas sp. K1W22B-7]|uniref:hypothetical protein n=1 Tax=Solimonas sp. K1W22B-7 TaxID=2303331 RepID=UPI0013C49C0B|nr:hypothetical protein [Solimonas sp. K1W22B-7]